MNFLLQLIIAIISASLGYVFAIASTKYTKRQDLLEKQLTSVYTLIYREICFAHISNNPKQLISNIQQIVYDNFQYVPEDIFGYTIYFIDNVKKQNYNLWKDPKWNQFIKEVEGQYLIFQEDMKYDSKLESKLMRKYKLSKKINNYLRYIPYLIIFVETLLIVVVFFTIVEIAQITGTGFSKFDAIYLFIPFVFVICFIYFVDKH